MSTSTPNSISVIEQVYTSASVLLDKAHGDLGVVCETAGFPAETQADLDSLNSYQPHDDLSGESFEKHPPAYSIAVRGLKRRFYTISRTVFAGADHTGRTKPLAHHMLIPADGISESVAPTDVLNSLSGLFLSQWNDEPCRREQPRHLTIVPRLGKGQGFPSSTWLRMISIARTSAILGFCAEHLTSNSTSADVPVVFVVPPSLGESVYDLLKDLLAVIPASFAISVTARTHVITPPSASGQSRVMFTYVDTPFLAQSRRRQDAKRPVIIDLVQGDTSDLFCQDYGRSIERVVSGGGVASDLETLVSRRNQMGELRNSGGAPFTDFCMLLERLRSHEPFCNLETTLPLMKNVADASESAGNVVGELMASVIRDHVNAQKSCSDWPALVKLAIDGPLPRKAQRLALKAIEQFSSYAFPHVFEHLQRCGKSGEKIKVWLRKLAERPGAVTSMIQHAIKTPSDRNVQCVQKTLFDLRPTVMPIELEKTVQILPKSEDSIAQPMRPLVSKFMAQEIVAQNLGPLTLEAAISQLVGDCQATERNEILFDMMEASANTSQLRDFVQWVAETFGSEMHFIPGYEDSGHSPPVRAAIRDWSTTGVGQSTHFPQPSPDRHRKSNMSTPPSLGRGGSSRTSKSSTVEGLVGWCWWLFVGAVAVVMVSVIAFLYDWKSPWDPNLHIPGSWPTASQRGGLAAFPMSAVVYALMWWMVKKNTGPGARVSTSIWYLSVALIAIVIGTAATLYTGYCWYINE